MTFGFKSLILAGLLASAGFASFAQTAAAPGSDAAPAAMGGTSGPRSGKGHGGPMGMHGRMDTAKMDAMAAKHHAELKAKLKITAEQEGAWAAFTTAMKPAAGMMMDHKRPDRTEMDKLTTPERIDKLRALRSQHMADRNAAMDKRDEATKALYAVLTSDQQKTFDAEHARMGGQHQGEHRHHGAAHKANDKPAAK